MTYRLHLRFLLSTSNDHFFGSLCMWKVNNIDTYLWTWHFTCEMSECFSHECLKDFLRAFEHTLCLLEQRNVIAWIYRSEHGYIMCKKKQDWPCTDLCGWCRWQITEENSKWWEGMVTCSQPPDEKTADRKWKILTRKEKFNVDRSCDKVMLKLFFYYQELIHYRFILKLKQSIKNCTKRSWIWY